MKLLQIGKKKNRNKFEITTRNKSTRIRNSFKEI